MDLDEDADDGGVSTGLEYSGHSIFRDANGFYYVKIDGERLEDATIEGLEVKIDARTASFKP